MKTIEGVFNGPTNGTTGVVDQYIDHAMFGHDLLHHGLSGSHIGQIADMGMQFQTGGLELFNDFIQLRSRLKDAEKLYAEAVECTPADAMERLDIEAAKAEMDD